MTSEEYHKEDSYEPRHTILENFTDHMTLTSIIGVSNGGFHILIRDVYVGGSPFPEWKSFIGPLLVPHPLCHYTIYIAYSSVCTLSREMKVDNMCRTFIHFW